MALLRNVQPEAARRERGDQHGGLCRDPEGAAQAGVAIFRDLAAAPELPRLHGGQVHSAELQELAVMAKATQVAGLGQNGERIDGADARDRAQEAIVRMVGEQGCVSKVVEIACARPPSVSGFAFSSSEVKGHRLEGL